MKTNLYLLLFLVILKTGTAQWSQITSPYAGNFWAIKFFDQNNGYIGGNTAILKTTNGGNSWTSTAISNFSINGLSFPSSTVGYYAANNNIVAKTINQGSTWTNQNPNASPYAILSVDFPTIDIGYAVGNAGVIRKTINGGTSWTAQTSGITGDINEVHFFDANVGVCIGASGKIKRTINGGASWTTVSSGTTENLYDMYFIDANTGFIAGGTGKILKTTNAGLSWTSLTSGSTKWLYCICFKNSLVGYAGGASGTLLKTIDGGVTWQPEVSGFSIQAFNDIVYINNRFIVVGDQGVIITDVAPVGINENSTSNPLNFVYPNPASDFFTIDYANPTNLTTTIKVYDLNGALVKSELLRENHQKINIENLSNGVYTVEINSTDYSVKNRLVVTR